MRTLSLLVILLTFAFACDQKQAAPAPTATAKSTATVVVAAPLTRAERVDPIKKRADDQLEFIAMALFDHREMLEDVTCHCCGKSLAKCYTETLAGESGACPPT